MAAADGDAAAVAGVGEGGATFEIAGGATFGTGGTAAAGARLRFPSAAAAFLLFFFAPEGATFGSGAAELTSGARMSSAHASSSAATVPPSMCGRGR